MTPQRPGQGAFDAQGFLLLRRFFRPAELAALEDALRASHRRWRRDNRRGWRRGLLNSAYLTARGVMPDPQRTALFRFIVQPRLLRLARRLLAGRPAFINTQLFFAPRNPAQRNYWHRDVQYTGLDEASQRAALESPRVLHFRIALAPDPGVELVPGSQRRWDTPGERDVRLARNGRHVWDELPGARLLPMRPGDLLIFSANMLHRARYDAHRFSLDILFAEPHPAVTRYVRGDCLPERGQARRLRRLAVFRRARRR